MRKGITLVLAVSLAAGLLMGCGNSQTSSTESVVQNSEKTSEGAGQPSTPPETEKSGGDLKIAINTECIHTMLSFDLTGAGADYYYSWPVYESLFKPNEEGTVDPWLLEDYSYDPDALTYTFHVRKGVTFADGTVLDAEAVKWNLDHYLEVGAKVEALLSSIDSVEVIDEYTVQLNLNK